jgi:hypothetical protein
VLVTEFTEQNAADNPGPAEDQQQHGGKIAAQARLPSGQTVRYSCRRYNVRSPP